MVKNLLANAGGAGSIPGRGTKTPHAEGQPSLHATTAEKPVPNNGKQALLSTNGGSLQAATKIQHSQ